MYPARLVHAANRRAYKQFNSLQLREENIVDNRVVLVTGEVLAESVLESLMHLPALAAK